MEQQELLNMFELISKLSDNDMIHVTTAAADGNGSRVAQIPVYVVRQYFAIKNKVTIKDGQVYVGGELVIDDSTGKPVSIYGKPSYTMSEDSYVALRDAGALKDGYYLTTEGNTET